MQISYEMWNNVIVYEIRTSEITLKNNSVSFYYILTVTNLQFFVVCHNAKYWTKHGYYNSVGEWSGSYLEISGASPDQDSRFHSLKKLKFKTL